MGLMLDMTNTVGTYVRALMNFPQTAQDQGTISCTVENRRNVARNVINVRVIKRNIKGQLKLQEAPRDREKTVWY